MNKIVIIILILISGVYSYGQYKSPFNNRQIQNDSTGSYAFVVSGHFYGDRNNRSRFPANTLLANLEWINGAENDMLVCLGDLFKDISNDIPGYETALFDKLEIPLVNAVGNHDLTGSVYQDNYGETSFFFELNGDIHLILDTEEFDGDIEGKQLDYLKEIKQKSEQGNVNNVFIYTHRTVWSKAYDEMDGLFTDNTQSITGTNYESDVLPILKEIGEKSNVYWFSGSLGTAPASFFHFKDEESNVTIIATAIRSLPRDAVLRVSVNQGKVSFETKSLTGQDLLSLEEYDVAYWQTEVGEEPFNWKLVPYYMQLTVMHRYFWYGVIFTVLGMLSFRFVKRRLKRRGNN